MIRKKVTEKEVPPDLSALKMLKDEFGKNDFKYVSIYECASAEIAAKVEICMKKIGFDIGNTDVEGCGGNENSIYVYMFRKPVGEESHESLDELLAEYAKKRL